MTVFKTGGEAPPWPKFWLDSQDAEKYVTERLSSLPTTTADSILAAAAKHMQDRAAVYDKPEGERSMAATVAAFNAQTGHALSEADGWLLMVNLKIVRDRQRKTAHTDSLEDLVAYSALMGEARISEKP